MFSSFLARVTFLPFDGVFADSSPCDHRVIFQLWFSVNGTSLRYFVTRKEAVQHIKRGGENIILEIQPNPSSNWRGKSSWWLTNVHKFHLYHDFKRKHTSKQPWFDLYRLTHSNKIWFYFIFAWKIMVFQYSSNFRREREGYLWA